MYCMSIQHLLIWIALPFHQTQTSHMQTISFRYDDTFRLFSEKYLHFNYYLYVMADITILYHLKTTTTKTLKLIIKCISNLDITHFNGQYEKINLNFEIY